MMILPDIVFRFAQKSAFYGHGRDLRHLLMSRLAVIYPFLKSRA